MGNMSYCRFENTARDLKDCVNAIQNGETEDLSSYEIQGLNRLLDYAETIVHYGDDIKEILQEYYER
jgi:hypothetical protein